MSISALKFPSRNHPNATTPKSSSPLGRSAAAAVLAMLDIRPIEIGGFKLKARTVEAIETPTIQGWQLAFEFASEVEQASPFWVGDLLAYAEDRRDWREKLSQAMSVTKLAKHSLQNRSTISKKVTGRARELAPTLGHAAVVTKLEPEEQEEFLERARDEEWTVQELGHAVKTRKKVIAGQSPAVHDVIVSVCVSVEASSGTAAERLAWDAVKPYAKEIAKNRTVLAARIAGAKARPQ